MLQSFPKCYSQNLVHTTQNIYLMQHIWLLVIAKTKVKKMIQKVIDSAHKAIYTKVNKTNNKKKINVCISYIVA